jgi:glycosyltransferase involved in cell wall biosynthesis
MNAITLSYILTTYNKLPYLSVTLPLLIANKKTDEEIVIVDGGSTDGTIEYLDKLFKEKKIDQFLSEKDAGEAHGTNKAMLMAKGALIKIITDDDVFHFNTIRVCKTFMLTHTSIDMLGFNGFGFNTNQIANIFTKTDQTSGFKRWKITGEPFLFSGLSFMMRRSSLAYLGLFNVNYMIVDYEYAIRVTAMKTELAFYTGMGYVNIVNPKSNSHKFYETLHKERRKLSKIYPSFRQDKNFQYLIMRGKDFISRRVLGKPASLMALHDFDETVKESVKKLDEYNDGKNCIFLT